MKIVFDHQIFGWQKYGGISRYIFELAVQLSAHSENDVTVASPLYVNEYLKKAPKSLKVFGMHVRLLPKTGRILRAINHLIVWLFVRDLRPSIFHETYYSSKRLAPETSKVILTVHDMIHERFSEQFSPFDSTMREKAIAVARADHIICISEQTRKDLIALLNVSPDKISVVYHGYTLYCHPHLIKKIDDGSQPFLLYVGARAGYKNFESLVKAYADSDYLTANFELVCFGGGAFSSKEQDMIKALNIKAKSLRQVSGSDEMLAGFYETASAFVYPSLYEGFGIPPLEAMSFSCPVVCSDVSSIPEVVGDAAEMFDPYDIKSIQSAIERVVQDEDLKKELISRGKERIKQFSWERCAQETLKIYKNVSGK